MRRFLPIVYVIALVCAGISGTARAASTQPLLGGNCGSLSPVFAPWSDPASYYLAPNGGFEQGSTGWSLSGPAAIVAGNDPFKLSGAGSSALRLGAGGVAATTVCYGLTYPAVRFVVAGVGGPAVVHVRIASRNVLGVVSVLDGGTFVAASGWAPGPKLSTLFSALVAPLGAKTMQIELSVEKGTALFDDLYVDPFLTKG